MPEKLTPEMRDKILQEGESDLGSDSNQSEYVAGVLPQELWPDAQLLGLGANPTIQQVDRKYHMLKNMLGANFIPSKEPGKFTVVSEQDIQFKLQEVRDIQTQARAELESAYKRLSDFFHDEVDTAELEMPEGIPQPKDPL